jgi:hypothetical protein
MSASHKLSCPVNGLFFVGNTRVFDIAVIHQASFPEFPLLSLAVISRPLLTTAPVRNRNPT